MRPLAKAAALLPPAALRADPGVLVTALLRYAPTQIHAHTHTQRHAVLRLV